MRPDRAHALATLIVVGTGMLWGFYWMPVRQLGGLGLEGPWGTVAIVGAAVLLMAPLAWRDRLRLMRSGPLTLGFVALGGAGFALYSIGFIYGRVAIIILLFFLTPVWSTLIARLILGHPTARMRLVAIAIGLAGLVVMLGANGETPVPQGTGEWLALASGILWSVATTGIRMRQAVEPVAAAFVFASGGFLAALVVALILAPEPAPVPDGNAIAVAGLALATGGLWWGLSMAALLWAALRLEPARVGILLMAEVLVGMTSAALLAGEPLGRFEIIGGAMVICAGFLEVWPERQPHAPRREAAGGDRPGV